MKVRLICGSYWTWATMYCGWKSDTYHYPDISHFLGKKSYFLCWQWRWPDSGGLHRNCPHSGYTELNQPWKKQARRLSAEAVAWGIEAWGSNGKLLGTEKNRFSPKLESKNSSENSRRVVRHVLVLHGSMGTIRQWADEKPGFKCQESDCWMSCSCASATSLCLGRGDTGAQGGDRQHREPGTTT